MQPRKSKEELLQHRKNKMKKLPTPEEFAKEKREDSLIAVRRGGSIPSTRIRDKAEEEMIERKGIQRVKAEKEKIRKAKSSERARMKANETYRGFGEWGSTFSENKKTGKSKNKRDLLPTLVEEEEPEIKQKNKLGSK